MKAPKISNRFLVLTALVIVISIVFSLLAASIIPAIEIISIFVIALLLYNGDRKKSTTILSVIVIGFLFVLVIWLLALSRNSSSPPTEELIVFFAAFLMVLFVVSVPIAFQNYVEGKTNLFGLLDRRVTDDPAPLFQAKGIQYSMARDDGYTWTSRKTGDFVIMPTHVQLSGGFSKVTFNGDNLRWMWESAGILTLDLNANGIWQTYEIHMSDKEVQRAANLLEDMAESAGRRLPKRPGRRLEHVRAQPATQDIYGSWSLGETVSLYLTPTYLVVIQNGYVQREILLHEITNITALARIDNPDEHGLLQFDTGVETLTFATLEYETFAATLAQATRKDFERLESQKRKQDDEV